MTVTDGANGKSFEAPVVSLPAARLDTVALGNPVASAYDYQREDTIGIIGPNLFPDSLVYLEFGRQRIRLVDKAEATPPSEDVIPYLAAAGGPTDLMPAINIELPGLTVPAQLDSGSDGSFSLPLAMADKVPLVSPPVPVGTATSVSGTQVVYGAKIKGQVRIGTVTLDNPDVTFGGLIANVGLPIIRRMTVVLDPASHKGWVLRPRTFSATELVAYAGRYGERTLRVERETLFYKRDGRDEYKLVNIGSDLFENPATGDLVQFVRKDGAITGFDLVFADDRSVRVRRSG